MVPQVADHAFVLTRFLGDDAHQRFAELMPVAGVAAYQLDGIFIGATRTADMRNMMILSVAVYLAAWAMLTPPFANHGLWAALIVLFVVRGVTLAVRLPHLERDAFPEHTPVRAT